MSSSKYSNEEFSRMTARMRTYLTSLARRRNSGTVTADDAHTYLDRQGVKSQPTTRLRFINSVLRQPMFFQAGTVASSRPAARGRAITEWTV
jgi:hypothetical protein